MMIVVLTDVESAEFWLVDSNRIIIVMITVRILIGSKMRIKVKNPIKLRISPSTKVSNPWIPAWSTFTKFVSFCSIFIFDFLIDNLVHWFFIRVPNSTNDLTRFYRSILNYFNINYSDSDLNCAAISCKFHQQFDEILPMKVEIHRSRDKPIRTANPSLLF